jgi:RNA polymerase sigma-70 factor (ECF subfamily)
MGSGQANPEAEIRLMDKAGKGDRAAFSELYRLHFETVRDFIAVRNGHHELSPADLAQEVFVRAWRSAGRFRSGSSVKTYLLGIAGNVLREQKNGIKSRPPFELLSDNQFETSGKEAPGPKLTDPEISASTAEQHALLVSRIASLPLLSRQAIDLAVVQGLSTTEAAAEAGCSPKNFRQRLRRALLALSGDKAIHFKGLR